MQRDVGRRTPKGIMGLQNDLADLHRGNPLFASLQGRSHDTSGDWGTSLRREAYNQEENFALQRYELDLLEEKCDLADLRIASYK